MKRKVNHDGVSHNIDSLGRMSGGFEVPVIARLEPAPLQNGEAIQVSVMLKNETSVLFVDRGQIPRTSE